MEIRQLKTFVTAAQLGSFVDASKILDYAPSTITAQIHLLEEELNIKLFERLGKQVILTSQGQILRTYAQQILKLSDEAIGATCGTSINGTITIGIAESLAVIRLPEVFSAYRRVYPNVELDVKFGPCSEFKSYLRKNTIDVAIILERSIIDQDLLVEIAYPEPMTLLCAPDHPLAQKKSVDPSDLANETLLVTESGCGYRTILENMLANVGVQFRSVMAVSSVQAEKQFAASGLGICLLTSIAVEQDVAEKRLVALPWDGPDFKIVAQVVRHKNKWLSPALQVFMDLVSQEFKRQAKIHTATSLD
ncbi:MAG: LysR family transcriptional regulator [Negativicutes bacterium]